MCRMICRLPREKALLLRHLLAVLHGIQSNAEDNQMTSFNLSVCIAPSLLWPPGAACSPEAEGEGAKKVRAGSWAPGAAPVHRRRPLSPSGVRAGEVHDRPL